MKEYNLMGTKEASSRAFENNEEFEDGGQIRSCRVYNKIMLRD